MKTTLKRDNRLGIELNVLQNGIYDVRTYTTTTWPTLLSCSRFYTPGAARRYFAKCKLSAIRATQC